MAKKTAAKKKLRKAPTQQEIRRVFGECAFAIGQGAERQAVASGVRISLSPEAVRFWADRYWKTVPKGMRVSPWRRAKATVLLQAQQLGVEAAKASIAQAPPGTTDVVISKDAVAGASGQVEKDPTCAQVTKGGGGKFCEVDPAAP